MGGQSAYGSAHLSYTPASGREARFTDLVMQRFVAAAN
jgi:hypothetical protein